MNHILLVDKFNVLGGQERYLSFLVNYLKHDSGFNLSLFASKPNKHVLRQLFSTRSSSYPIFCTCLIDIVKNIVNRKYSIMVVNSLNPLHLFLAFLFFIFTLQKPIFVLHLASTQLRLKRPMVKYVSIFLEFLAVNCFFTRIISVSETVASLIPGKSTVIRNPSFYYPSCQSRFDINTLIWVGRLDTQKNPLFLLKAFKRLVETLPTSKVPHLKIYGDGPLRSDLLAYIRYNSLGDFVTLCGNKPQDSIYNVRCLQISTSSYEGMPLAVMEGLVNGNILLMSTIPSHIELVNGFPFTYLFDLHDPFSLSSLIYSLIMLDSSTLDQLSIASSDHYKPILSTSDFLQSWSRVLSDS